ncbi:hypothetical protein F5Y18DRAFT_396565 [Xylariaceae sp. FL1019]|nr:hypothetical protein F5Y18DRAFT_396565 [Xylariaceae sp. FL1019]
MPMLRSIAAASMLLASSYAMPHITELQPRATDSALEPWVTVGTDGSAVTVTPVQTTVDGTPTIVSAAPHDLTATVYTETYNLGISTTTGAPPQPTATNTDGSGSFSICNNLDGDMAPWCEPTAQDPLYVGTTYYFTWDSSYFNSTENATASIVGNYLNETTLEATEFAFQFDTYNAMGYKAVPITSEYLRYQGSQNITLTLLVLVNNNSKKVARPGPTILVRNRPGYKAESGRGRLPQGAALYIAIPTVFGFIFLCVIGGCWWNARHRRIELGNVMSRSRKPFSGIGDKISRTRKTRKANERIQLMEREVAAEGGEMYRDIPEPPQRPRRDSNDLGSLAGTPTEDRQMNLGRPTDRGDSPTRGNAFRDELKRQDNQRL